MRVWLQAMLSIVGLCSSVAAAESDSFGRIDVLIATGPDTSISSNPSVTTNQTSATFTFSSPTSGVSYECALDTTNYAPCTSPKQYSNVADGRHTFWVRAVDAAGNKDDSPARFIWKVDTIPPTAQLSQPSDGAVVSAPVVIKGMVDEPFSMVRIFINEQAAGEVYADGNGAWSFEVSQQLSSDKDHYVSVEAVDSANNVGARTKIIKFKVDAEPPETMIVDGPSRTLNSRLAAFEFSSSKGTVQFECRLDDAPDFTICGKTWLFSGLSNGHHVLRVRAKDIAGNVDPTPASYEWIVVQPQSAPEISAPAEGAVVDTQTPIISGSAGAYGLVAVYVDDKKIGVAQADEGGNWSLRPATPLEEGEHKLTVEAAEGVGSSGEVRSPVRSFSVSLGGCAASGSQPLLPLVGLGLALLAKRRRHP